MPDWWAKFTSNPRAVWGAIGALVILVAATIYFVRRYLAQRPTPEELAGARLSVSGNATSIFMRATFSPGIVRRICAASSVVNISESAVDSQAR